MTLSKQALAVIAAELLNLVNDVDKNEWTQKQIDALNNVVHSLSDDLRDDFFNNATITAANLLGKSL